MDDSITVEILKSIRDEIRTTRETLHADLRETREQLTDRLERLEHKQTESDIRLSTELVGITSAIVQVRDLVRDNKVRAQVRDHERRITELEKKTG